jgi:hypothetical protein
VVVMWVTGVVVLVMCGSRVVCGGGGVTWRSRW